MKTIKNKLQEYNIPYEENVSLKEKTWIKTGGIVSLWITPTTVDTLEKTIKLLYSEKVYFELVGHSSNIYYLDEYNSVIILSTIKVKDYKENEDFIRRLHFKRALQSFIKESPIAYTIHF